MDGDDSSAALSMRKYDVFISFRGSDVRYGFLSHLVAALRQKSIKTFIIDELHEGDEILPAHLQAIEDSTVSLVILSENYASSELCLEELIKIMELKKNTIKVVIPVFYGTVPSMFRYQRGICGKAFEQHEKKWPNDPVKILKWRRALTEACNLSGWHSANHRSDSELIQRIVNNVLQVLNKMRPIQLMLPKLVGIDERCEHIELLLKKFAVVGICGVSGIGKTTIAKVVYAKLFPQFDSCCFFENVGEKSKRYGLNYLRDKLLYELHEEEGSHIIAKGDRGSKYLLGSLRREKVLIVLDDVDDSNQLEYLSKECEDLAEGSRVIITTRDMNLLASVRVDKIYEVERLNFQEALQLISLYAFNRNSPKMGFEEPLKEGVAYCKGIPLALKILGSFLKSKSTGEWESVLATLEMIPNNDIQNVLRLSYNGLDSPDKELFLDIACFLNGEHKKHVMHLIESLGYSIVEIENLLDRGLLNISDNRVWMHDLLQKMGRDIVCEQYTEEHGRHSILDDSIQTHDFKENLGTHAVEGILLHKSQSADLHFANIFKKLMRTGIPNVDSPWIEWNRKVHFLQDDGFIPKSLASKFCPEELVEIRIPNSDVVKLWDGEQELVNLRRIDLRGSRQLRELPDLSKALNLESINLSHCESLRRLDVLGILNLVVLNLITNWRKMIERMLYSTIELAQYRIKEAASWKENYYPTKVYLPVTRVPSWFTYRTTQASITIELSCWNLLGFAFVVIPSDFAASEVLDYCGLGCECSVDGTVVGNSWFGNVGLVADHSYLWYDTELPKGILDAIRNTRTNDLNKVSFEFLVIVGRAGRRWDKGIKECGVRPIYASEHDNSIDPKDLSLQLALANKRPRNIFELEPGKTEIRIRGSGREFEMEDEPEVTKDLSDEDIFELGFSFETLQVTDVSQLKELPPNLHCLRVAGCHLLESLPDELMDNTSNVSELYAIDCPSLKYLVDGGNFTSLRDLYIDKCRKLEFLLSPDNFANLEHLCIGSSCDSLKNFTVNHFPKLKTLCIWNCLNLESLSISEQFEHVDLPLESLEIRDCPRLVSFPTKGLPTLNLMSLTLSNCIALRSLPNHMASLESLQTMFIDRCPELDSLPEGGLPSSLNLLSISLSDKLIPKKEWQLNRLHSLTRFEMESDCLCMDSFPEKDLLPTNLSSLRMSKLSSSGVLDYEGLQQLTALQSLDITCCHKNSSIPDKGLPSSMTRNLMDKLGADWCKIAHIPDIRIDEFISRNS